MKEEKGFTLIELLVVIAIIGLLSTVVMVSLNRARAKARDIRRLEDIKQITTALEMYYDKYGYYPVNTDTTDCGGWDVGNPGRGTSDTFIKPLETEGILSKTPIDPTNQYDSSCSYRYYRYGPDVNCGGYYYVLGVYLENPQTNYGMADQMDSCYTQIWWQNINWVGIMRKE